jgi:histidine triad (HIT) family protein
MPTIFSRIVSGEIPCYNVAESERFIAFLDINPVTLGHTLIVPKVEVDYLFDLEDEWLSEMILFAKEVAGKLQNSVECKRVGVAVIGLEVPHAHIHLIPLNSEADFDLHKPKMKLSKEEFLDIQSKIAKK